MPEPSKPIPLTTEQESYLRWGRDRLGAVPVFFRLYGELDVPALGRALTRVLSRHESLRMRLLDTPDGVRQVFPRAEAENCAIQVTTAVDGQTLEDVAARLAGGPIDLRAHGPVRAWLVRSGEDMLLVLLLNHMAVDAWSVGIFSKELLICYRAEVTGTDPKLPAAPRFSDYVLARQADQTPWSPAQHEYWRRVSRDYCERAAVPAISAPVGSPDQPGRSDLVCGLSADQMGELLGFARAAVVPPRTVELAGSLLAIWAWCPVPVIRAWCLHSGREDSALANAVGVYARNFPLAVRVDPTATLAEFSRDVLREWSTAVGYSAAPYSEGALRQMIAQAGGADPAIPDVRLNRLAPPRGMSQSQDPLVFGDSISVQSCDLESTRWSWYREPRLRIMSTFGKSLSVRAIFNPGLTPPGFAEEMMANLGTLLPLFAAENAGRPIGELVELAGLRPVTCLA